MAVVVGTISKFGQTSGSFPWTMTTAATIDTTGAEALLVFILNSNRAKGIPTVKFGGSGGVAMTLITSRTQGTNGKLFVFRLLAPAQTTTGSIYVNNPSENGDNTTMIVLPLSSVDLVNPWGTTAYVRGINGAAINYTLTTTAAGSTVFGVHTSVYGPGVGGMSETGGTAVTDADVDSSCVMKVIRSDVTASGGTAAGTATIDYADHMLLQVEIKGSSGPPKQTLTPSGIDNSSNNGLGNHLAKDPNKALLGPPSIDASSGNGLGGHTVNRTVVAYYDRNGPGHTVSGTPATVVERTSVAANYRVSTASVPVVSTEKKYWEVTVDAIAATSIPAVGVGVLATPLDAQLGGYQSDAVSWDASGGARDNNTGLNGKATYAANDILMIAVDMVNGWIFMGKNGTWYNGSTAGNVNFSSGNGKVNNTNRSTSVPLYPAVQTQNIGDKLTSNFGKAAFAYTPPTGFTALDAGGPGKKTLTAPSIDTTAALGSHTLSNLKLVLMPNGLLNTSAMGVHSVIQLASVSGLVNTSFLGSPNILYKTAVAGLLNTSALGSHSLVQLLKPTGLSNTSVLGAPSLIQRLTVAGIKEPASLGTPVVGSTYSLAVPGILNSNALGAPAVAQVLAVPGIENISAVGAPALTQKLGVASYVNASAIGGHTLNQGIKAPGYENLTELGSPVIKAGTIIVNPAGINSDITLGNPALHYVLTPTGISSTEGLGAPFVTHIYEDAGVYPPSIINASEFGSAKIISKIQMSGIAADQSVLGSPLVAPVLKLTVPSIVNAEAFGTGKLVLQIKPASIQNDSALGDPTAVAKLQVTGLGNVSGLGSHSVISDIKLSTFGIQNVNAFGEHEIRRAPIILTAPGIPGDAEVGAPRISLFVKPAGILNAPALGSHRLDLGVLMAPSIINVNSLGNHAVNLVIGDTPQFTRVNGQWVPVKSLMVRYENVWQEVDAILEKKNGIWVQIY